MAIEPMLAAPATYDDVLKGKFDGYWMEPKLDGVRCVALKDQSGSITLWTRGGKTMDAKFPHIVQVLDRFMPLDSILDGEVGYDTYQLVLWPTLDFNRTMRVVGSMPDEALRKQLIASAKGTNDVVKLYVFDILRWNSEDMTELEARIRQQALVQVASEHFAQPVELVHGMDRFDDDRYQDYVQAGGEGIMLKNIHGLYYPGKRKTKTWYKLKKYDSLDVVIMGYTPGQGKYQDQIGAIKFGLWNALTQEVVYQGKVSGMTDAERSEFSAAPSLFQGKVMEIRFFGKVGVDESGFRHPQFLRMRADKEIQDCPLA